MNHRFVQSAVFLCAIALLGGCSNRAEKPPRYAQVPEFHMTDAEGRPFDSGTLKGKVWVADFIYTNCPAECPMMSSKMKKFAGEVDPEVRLISISVDPARDSPEALKKFASHYGAPTAQWSFVTGSAHTVHLLAWSTFHLGDVISKMEHSTKFVLVDGHGFIRGYYSSFDADSMASLRRDANALRHDNS